MAIEIFELVITGRLASEFRQNVLHFQGTGTDPNDTEKSGDSLCTGWIANIDTAFLACLPPTYSRELLAARRATPKPSTVVKEQEQFGAVTGSRGVNAATQQVCPSIFLIPPAGTKSGGKIFMPAIPEGDLINNQFSNPYIAAVGTFITALQTGFTQDGITWIGFIYSRKLKSGVPIADHHLSPLIGIMDKRRVPLGD